MSARRDRIRAICDRARDRMAAIWKAPLVDPQAPDGYVTRGFADTETEIRLEQSRAVMAEAVAAIRAEYGDEYADAAEAHFASIDALMP